jgi:hypothetical protein
MALFSTIFRIAVSIALVCLLPACETSPAPVSTGSPPKAQLQYVDLQSFDRDLGNSLQAPLPKIEVAFYDRVTPSVMPARLESWMAAVESSGGSVTVVPPQSSVTAKSPFLLLSALSSLWTASKVAKEYSAKPSYKAARGYDAQIQLKLDDRGDSVVDKIVFLERKK